MALTQILTTDSVSASVVNAKIVDPANTALTGLQIAQTAGGTGTAITLTGVELTNGYQKTFIISASNSGAATTINGKTLYKPGGTVAPNLVAGKSASIWYNLAGDCFFIKASAEGTATVGDVLAGKTFSNDDDTGLSGTMVNNGVVSVVPKFSDIELLGNYAVGSIVKSKVLTAGDVLVYKSSFFTCPANQGAAYLVGPTVRVGRTGTVRVAFSAKAGYDGYNFYTRIYKNGVAVGIERLTTVGATATIYTEDITVNAEDVIAIYWKAPDGGFGGQIQYLSLSVEQPQFVYVA